MAKHKCDTLYIVFISSLRMLFMNDSGKSLIFIVLDELHTMVFTRSWYTLSVTCIYVQPVFGFMIVCHCTESTSTHNTHN